MKYLIQSLLAGLALCSCSSDNMPFTPNTGEQCVSFDISLPYSSEMRTRSDNGAGIREVDCFVYEHSGSGPLKTEKIAVASDGDRLCGRMSIVLPDVADFDFVFIASPEDPSSESSKVSYNPVERTLALDYSRITCCDTDVDCFFGVVSDVSAGKSDYSVTLRRPFAQLNICTKDLAAYNEMSCSDLSSVEVSVDGVFASMNVMDGSLLGSPLKIDLGDVSIPNGLQSPVEGADCLAMNYLLVNERREIGVGLTASNGVGQFSMDFQKIPVQRNCRTDIYGNLLTGERDFSVVVNPEFNDAIDDMRTFGYDVVLTVTEESGKLSLKYTDNGEEKEVDLLPFVDSELYVKFNWNALGVGNANHISFEKSDRLRSVDKCDISSLNVSDMSRMFTDCSNLESVETVKDWDTREVNSMRSMFYGCKKLSALDVSGFNTENVTDMSHMFEDCGGLSTLDVSNFNTGKVKNMGSMFMFCDRLRTLDVSNFNTENVTNMGEMFRGVRSVKSLDVSHFDTKKVTGMAAMFQDCDRLIALDLSNFDTKNVTDMNSMFYNTNLTSLDLSNFNTGKVKTMCYMFYLCNHLSTLDVSGFNTENVTDMSHMFEDCGGLSALDVSGFNTEKVTDMSYMFSRCSGLLTLDVSNFNTEKVTDMSHMFEYTSGLSDLNLSNFNTGKVKTMRSMFSYSNIVTLNISNFDLSAASSILSLDFMFDGCNLENVIGPVYNIKQSISIPTPLTNESAMVFINGLSAAAVDMSVTFSSDTYNTLSEAQKNIVINKNWTIKVAY